MNFKDAKTEIRKRYAELLEPAKRSGDYVCPLCGHGKNGDGLRVVPREKGGDGFRLHCFGCNFHGDILDLVKADRSIGEREAFKFLCRFFSLQVELPASSGRASGDVMARARDNLSSEAAVRYLAERGISLDTARSCGLGFLPDWVSPTAVARLRERGSSWTPPGSPRIIMPTSEGGYTARATDPATDPRFRKLKEGPAGFFNLQALYAREGRPVFVVEGEFDALAVIEAGGSAVALGSVANRRRFVGVLEQKKPFGTLILSLDNDKAGQNASIELSEALKGLSIPFVVKDIAEGFKDPSEAISGKREAFARKVHFLEQEVLAGPDCVAAYMAGPMRGELERFRAGSLRRTGFDVLDDETGGIYPGLYVLGAISSLGKTTFLHQMADQMAGAGQHVVYFSLEQSRLELISKSIARMASQRAGKALVSSLDIRLGRGDKNALKGLSEAFTAYSESVGERLSLVEGGEGCDVEGIGEYVRGYIGRMGVRPVVIVDYLQILQGGDERAGARERIDSSVIGLKRLSRELEVPVMVVSSVNRANYLAPVDFESFKESGGIEYTADVVWGLQLEVLNGELFGKEGRIREKREVVRRAKMAEPRKVELVCLKNRFGVSSFRVGFEYLAGCDWFREVLPQRDEVRY